MQVKACPGLLVLVSCSRSWFLNLHCLVPLSALCHIHSRTLRQHRVQLQCINFLYFTSKNKNIGYLWCWNKMGFLRFSQVVNYIQFLKCITVFSSWKSLQWKNCWSSTAAENCSPVTSSPFFFNTILHTIWCEINILSVFRCSIRSNPKQEQQ